MYNLSLPPPSLVAVPHPKAAALKAQAARRTVLIPAQPGLTRQALADQLASVQLDQSPPANIHFHRGHWVVEMQPPNQLPILLVKGSSMPPAHPQLPCLPVTRVLSLPPGKEPASTAQEPETQPESARFDWDRMGQLATVGDEMAELASGWGVRSEAAERADAFVASLLLTLLGETFPRATITAVRSSLPPLQGSPPDGIPQRLFFDPWPVLWPPQPIDQSAARPFTQVVPNSDQLCFTDHKISILLKYAELVTSIWHLEHAMCLYWTV